MCWYVENQLHALLCLPCDICTLCLELLCQRVEPSTLSWSSKINWIAGLRQKIVVVSTEKGKRLHQMSIMYPTPKDCFDDQVQWREGAFGKKNNLNLISEREQKQRVGKCETKSKSLERKWRVLTRLRFPLKASRHVLCAGFHSKHVQKQNQQTVCLRWTTMQGINKVWCLCRRWHDYIIGRIRVVSVRTRGNRKQGAPERKSGISKRGRITQTHLSSKYYKPLKGVLPSEYYPRPPLQLEYHALSCLSREPHKFFLFMGFLTLIVGKHFGRDFEFNRTALHWIGIDVATPSCQVNG